MGSIKNKAIGYVGFSYAESGDLGALTYEGVSPNVNNIKSGSSEGISSKSPPDLDFLYFVKQKIRSHFNRCSIPGLNSLNYIEYVSGLPPLILVFNIYSILVKIIKHWLD